MSEPMFKLGNIVIHQPTGKKYMVIYTPDKLRIESSDSPAYAYKDYVNPESILWVRPQTEMEDGRFEKVDQ